MSAHKKCLICNQPFAGRRDAKTCSPRCRKRLQLIRSELREPVMLGAAAAPVPVSRVVAATAGTPASITQPASPAAAPAKAKRRGVKKEKLFLGLFLALASALTLLLGYTTPKADALTASSDLNFQARLLNAAGAVVPDGNYNIEFKIYNADSTTGSQGSCSGSCLWMATYTGANVIPVTNGYFSVSLGTINTVGSFSSINWDQQLYLTMRIGGIGTPSWDGEMQNNGHSIPITAVPLAFRANQLAVAGTNEQILQFASNTFGQATTISLPDPGASTANVCYQSSAACGFALSSGSGNYIQNSAGGPQSANFNIISASSGSIGAVVHANASQSVDVFDVQNSASTVFFGVNSNGTQISLGATNPTIAATAANSNLSVNANGTGTLNLNNTGTANTIQVGNTSGAVNGTIKIGTNATSGATNTIQIGNAATATDSVTIGSNSVTGNSVNIEAGNTGKIQIGNTNAAHTIQIGAAGTSTIQAVTVGSTSSTSSVTIQGGTGTGVSIQSAAGGTLAIGTVSNNSVQLGTATTTGTIQIGGTGTTGQITLGQSTSSNTVSIGSNIGAGQAQTIYIGNGATGTGTIVIGNTAAGTVQLQPAGGVLMGKAGSLNGTLVFQNSVSTNTVTIAAQAVNPASSSTIYLPTAGGSGIQCLQSTSDSTATNTTLQFGSCAGSTPTLQQVYDASGSPQIVLDSSPGAGGIIIRDNATTSVGNAFQIQNAGGADTLLAANTKNLSINITGKENVVNDGTANTFPSTGVLDNFNRASLGSNWTTPASDTSNAMSIISSTQLGATVSGNSTAGWNVSKFGPDTEVYADVPTLPSSGNAVALIYRFDNTFYADAYAMLVEPSTDTWELLTEPSGTLVCTFSTTTPLLAGDSIGAMAVGTTHSAWRKTGGVWSQVGSNCTDSTFTRPGYIGVFTTDTTARLDNFGGGSINDTLTASNAGSTSNIAVFKNNNTAIATFYNGGSVLFQPAVDATGAFQVDDSTGNTFISVDTIGSSSDNSINLDTNPNFGGHINIGNTQEHAQNIDIGLTGSGNSGNNSNITIATNTNKSATNTIEIGAPYNPASGPGPSSNNSVTIEGGYTGGGKDGGVFIGNSDSIHTIEIGAAGSTTAQTVAIGSTSSTSAASISSGSGNIQLTSNGAAAGTLVQSLTNSTSAFQVQNSSGASGVLLNVDSLYSNITLNGMNNGDTNLWQSSANQLPALDDSNQAVAANGYLYVTGGENGSTASTSVYYTQLNADGSIDSWDTETQTLPAARRSHTTVVANGYIYVIGGTDVGSTAYNTVYYAKLNPDGTTSAWQQDPNSLPSAIKSGGSFVYNGYIYLVGGDSSFGNPQDETYFAKVNADGTTGAWQSATGSFTAEDYLNSSVATANGYAYIIGGGNSSGVPVNTVYYGGINSSGNIGLWTATTHLPVALQKVSVVILNGYIYAIGGQNSTPAGVNTVYYAKLNNNGTINSWSMSTHTLGDLDYLSGTATDNGYIYLTGGNNGSGSRKTVFYTATSRIQIGGSLDLVGASAGGTLQGTDGSGSLTAGNTQIVGSLQVNGDSRFANSLAVTGNINSSGSVLFQDNTNSTSAFQVQNSSGSELFNADTSNMRLGVNVTYAAMNKPSAVNANTQPQAPTPTVTPAGGTATTSYSYEVEAFNNGQLWSTVSAAGSTSTGEPFGSLGGSVYNLISWSAVSGATSYQIFRTVGGTTGLIGSSTTTSFKDYGFAGNGGTGKGNGTILTASTTYYYRITAIDGTGGETNGSGEVSASSGTTDRVDLSWGAVPGAAGYRIYQGTASGAETYLDTTSTNVYTDGWISNKNPGLTSPPGSNTAYVATNTANSALQISIGGNGQPTGQLYVSGTLPTAAVGTYNFNNVVSNDGAPYGVAVQGKYAYTAHHGGNLDVLDISNPQNPQRIGIVDVGNAPDAVAVSGRYAYVVSGLSSCAASACQLSVVDISNPANPTIVAQLSTGASSFPLGIYVQGRYAYVAYAGTNQLGIWDISNPADPVNVDNIATQHGSPQGVFVQGRYAYLSDGSDWLETIDVSNPSAAATVSGSAIATSGYAPALYVQGNYAYVADSGVNGIDIFNIADPASPRLVTSVATGSGSTSPNGVFVQDHYAYVANYFTGNNTIGVVDIAQPSAPTLVGTIPATKPISLFAQGRYLYSVSDTGVSLQVFDLGGTYTQQLEAGGAELGTLAVDSNSMFAGDVSIQGGTTIGQSLAVGGDLSVSGTNISLASGNNANTVQIANDQISNSAFPATPILDNFNRANGAPGSNWATIDPSYQVPNITSNQLQQISTGTYPDGYWTTKFRPDQEVYVEFGGYPSADQSVLMLRLSGIPSESENGYEARFNGTQVIINKVTSASRTALGTFSMSGQLWAGFRAQGNTLTAYVSNDGVTWTSVGSVTDSTYDNSGYIGFFSNDGSGVLHTYDNFGGGAIPSNDGNTQSVTIGSTGGASSLLLQSGTGNTVLSSSGSTIVKPYTDSTAAFQVQNTAGSAILNADTVNAKITFGDSGGDLTAWQTSANPLPAATSSNPAVAANGYMYLIGGSGATRNISYSKLNGDGTNGAWTTQTNILPVSDDYSGAVFYNGYLYIVGGYNGSADVATVYYAKLNPLNGSVGTLQTTTALPDILSDPGVVQINGYMYVLGGSDGSPTTSVYYAKLNPDGTVGAWQTGTSLSTLYASGLKAEAAVAANGNIYLFGGSNGSYISNVSYISVNSDGSMGATWTASANMPGTRGFMSAVLVNGYVYVVGGYGANGSALYAPLNNNGTLGAWSTASNVMPLPVAEAPAVTSNGYIYVLGGWDSGAGGLQSAVYYTSTARVLVGGSLDLVGLSGASLSDAGQTGGAGSLGGSLTAGNTQIVGSLQVQGAASFAQGMNVSGAVTLAGPLTVAGSLPSAALATITTGSAPNQVVIQGHYAYLNNYTSSTFQVIDITNPASPYTVYTGNPGSALDNPNDITVAGHYAYIGNATGTTTIVILDISNPYAPSVVKTISGDGAPHWVDIEGRYLYDTTYGGDSLEIWDVSNPANPVRISDTALGGQGASVYVQGSYAYVTDYTNAKLYVYNVSNPASPTIVNGSGTATGTNPREVVVSGRYAYVVTYYGRSFQVFDVSNPASPSSVATLSTSGKLGGLVVQGHYAYVTDHDNNLLIAIDISNPASPVQASSVATNAAPWLLAVSGRYAYVPNNGTTNMQVFDLGGAYVQQLEAGGTETGTLQVDSNAQVAGDMNIQGGTTIGQSLAVAGNVSVGGQLYIAGSVPTSATGTTATGDAPQGLTVQGNYAYTVSNIGNDLEVYNVANPANPFQVTTVTTGTSSAPYDLAVSGSYAYVVDYGTSDLQIFNISDPGVPVSVGTVSTGTNPDSVYVQGRYAYVVTYTSDTLEVYDVSNPANPVKVGSSSVITNPWSVFVQGRYAYVGANAQGDIQTLDVSNPANPTVKDSQGVNGTAHMQLYVQGGYTYAVNNGTSTLDIYNTTDPTLLSAPIGSVNINSGTGPSIYVQGHYVYVSNNNGTILIIDVSNPASPTVVGTISNTASSGNTAVYVNGRYLYEVGYDGTNGHLWVYDLGGAYIQQVESGGTVTGTLQVSSNGQFSGDVSIQGGTSIGQSLAVGGNLGVAGSLQIGQSTVANATIVLNNASNENTLTIVTGATAANTTIYLPSTMPATSVQQSASYLPLITNLTADTAASSSTTLAAIQASGNANDSLSFTIPAGKTVNFKVNLIYVSASSTSNSGKFGWVCSNASQLSTATGWMDYVASSATTGVSIQNGGTITACGTTAAAILSGLTGTITSTNGTPWSVEITGTIKANAGSATTVTFEYARSGAAGSTTVKAGSYVEWWQ